MTALKIRTVDTPNAPIGKSGWIQTALKCLIDEGIDAVQITRLARTLGVTRGSFYWNFADRQDLLDAMLDEWRAANKPVMAEVLERANTLSDAVLSFFLIWEEQEQFNPQLDQAVRDWARLSDDVLKIVREEDASRIIAIAAMFTRFGIDEDEAQVRARVLYFGQVGYYAMNVGDSMSNRLSMLEHYYRIFTGQALDPESCERFRLKMERITA